MGRRTTRADSEAAASQASEAARVLAQRSHESRSEPSPEPAEPAPHVEKAIDPTRVERLLNARPSVQARDEIIRKRGLDKEEEPEPKPELKTEPKLEVESQLEPEAKVGAQTEASPVETPKTVKVKVDGEEFDAPAEEVEAAGGVKAFQMMKASENRLAKANKLVEESGKSQAEILKLAQALIQQQPRTQPQPQLSDAQFIASKLQTIRFGSDEEGAAALQEILQRKLPQIDHQAIVTHATNHIENKRAASAFKTKNPDVFANPTLTELAIALERKHAAQLTKGQVVDWDGFYSKIEHEIRAIAPLRQSQPQAQPKTDGTTSQPSVKEERKASITTIPTAAARAALPEPEKELSPEEERKAWIASQKKSRGQG